MFCQTAEQLCCKHFFFTEPVLIDKINYINLLYPELKQEALLWLEADVR
jgi:hypothetical protein